MRSVTPSDNNHMFGNSIESSELNIPDNGKEAGCELFYDTRSDSCDKGKDGNHSCEFKSDTKTEDINNNHDSREDPPVFYMAKNVTACDLPEILVSSNKELTYNFVKDICVDEGVPTMQEKFLLNEKDSINVNTDPLEESKFEDSTGEFLDTQDYTKHNQEKMIVIREEDKDDSQVHHEVDCEKSPPSDVVASVAKETLTLGDIISMEDSQKHHNNNNNIEESAARKTELEKTEEEETDRLTDLDVNFESQRNQQQNFLLEDSYDHNLLSRNFPNGFGERSFSEAESCLAHITYSGPISVSGSLSVRSDGSTVSGRSFTFPILQSEWNSSPIRMVRPEKRQLRREKGWRHYSLLLCCRF